MTDTFFSCKCCGNKTCLKTLKPCKTVEKMLPKDHTGRLYNEGSYDPGLMNVKLIKTPEGWYKFLRPLKKPNAED